jgi:CheY-like chemotaxis protein
MNTAAPTAIHPLTALVADDEEAPRQQLIGALRQAWPELHIVAEAVNGVDAWDAWLEHEPDLCFLDIRMPGLTGIDVARALPGARRWCSSPPTATTPWPPSTPARWTT